VRLKIVELYRRLSLKKLSFTNYSSNWTIFPPIGVYMTTWLEHLEFGWNALDSNKPLVASTHFLAAYKSNPDSAVTCFAYGYQLAQNEQYSEAEPILKKAFVLDETLIPAACYWARVSSLLYENSDKSIEFLIDLEKKKPEQHLIQLTLVELYLKKGDEKSAQKTLRRVKDKSGEQEAIDLAKAKIHQLKGLKFVDSGEFKKGEVEFAKALELDETWAGPLINLGALQEKKGMNSEALILYEKALEVEPNHPVALYNLAHINFSTGNIVSASRFLKTLLRVNPEYPQAQNLAEKIIKANNV
jgi:tetratricopeptide (TPR) repeat protein